MDNLSGKCNWTVADNIIKTNEKIKTLKKKKRKIDKPSIKRINSFIKEIENLYIVYPDKYLGDLLVNLNTSKNIYSTFLKNNINLNQ